MIECELPLPLNRSIIFFYWSIVTLHCYASFCCKAKWISHTYACIPFLFGFPSLIGHHRDQVEFPVLKSRFLLVIYLYIVVYVYLYCMWRTFSLEKTQCWEKFKAGGEGDDRGWGGWMASPAWWTWVWASSGSWWQTYSRESWRAAVHRVTESDTTERCQSQPPNSSHHLPYPLVSMCFFSTFVPLFLICK